MNRETLEKKMLECAHIVKAAESSGALPTEAQAIALTCTLGLLIDQQVDVEEAIRENTAQQDRTAAALERIAEVMGYPIQVQTVAQ